MSNPPIKILAIDDEPLLLWALERACDGRRLDIETSSSSQQALKVLEENCFDLFLVDFDPRNTARAELLKAIDERYPYVPIIIMTTFDTKSCELSDTIRTIRKQGEWHLLEKPFRLNKLIAFIEVIFQLEGNVKVCLNSLTHNYDQEKRSQLRRLHVKPVSISFDEEVDGAPKRIHSKGILTDISNFGSCLLVNEQLQPEQIIRFEDADLKLCGRISWCTMIEEATYRCGVQFY